MIGAVVGGIEIRDRDHLRVLFETRPDLIVTEMDTPITPEFRGCCPFTFVELERGD